MASSAQAKTPSIRVTPDNFVRAETDWYFGTFAGRGGLGKFDHRRELPPIDIPSVRPNRDTLYSQGVFDLDAGPVMIALPDAGGRFFSMMITDQDDYVPQVIYDAGQYRFTRESIGTRYVLASIRILVDPNDPEDMAQVHALQDAIRVEQPGGPGRWEAPQWDEVSQKKVRDCLKALGETLPDWNGAAGPSGQVDVVRHLIVAASGWGLNPDKDAIYLNFVPDQNDGTGVFRLQVPAEVPVDGFWSVSLYDEAGLYQKNDRGAYTVNNVTAQKDADVGILIQFGGCDGNTRNCLPIFPGWNYTVRLYRPREEIRDGSWTFPLLTGSG